MHSPQEIAIVIKKLIKEQNLKTGEMLKSCSLGKNTVSDMSKGIMPSAEKLYKIATYLSVSTDFLLYGSDHELPKNKEKIFTENEQELLKLLNKFPDERSQIKFIGRAEALANEMLSEMNNDEHKKGIV